MIKSFRLSHSTASFTIVSGPQILHNSKEWLRGFFLSRFGLSIDVLTAIRSLIGERDFNEPHELFDSLRAFFLARYPYVNLSIYRYNEAAKALDFYLGDSYSNTKKIRLSHVGPDEYVNEQAALKSGLFECDITIPGFGGKGAVRIEDFILTFQGRGRRYKKNLRDLHAVFTVGLSELIRSKLLIIKEKYTDPRTGLYNSKYLQEVGSKKPYSIIRIDINDFKAFNDTYGHAAGDKILESLGKVLASSVRSDDKACRDGGDEFLLLIDSSELIAIERIIDRIHKLTEIMNEHLGYAVTVSVGYALYDGKTSFPERVNLADAQMYASKSEKSHIYRLAKRISLIKNPEDLQQLMNQIQSAMNTNSPS